MQTHIVQKAFEGAGGRTFKPGEEIDASGFRNVAGLVTARYLRPIQQEVPGAGEIVALLGDLRAAVENQSAQIESLDKRIALLEQKTGNRR